MGSVPGVVVQGLREDEDSVWALPLGIPHCSEKPPSTHGYTELPNMTPVRSNRRWDRR